MQTKHCIIRHGLDFACEYGLCQTFARPTDIWHDVPRDRQVIGPAAEAVLLIGDCIWVRLSELRLFYNVISLR